MSFPTKRFLTPCLSLTKTSISQSPLYSSKCFYSSRTARRNARSTYKATIYKPSIPTGVPRGTNFHSKLASLPDWDFANSNKSAPEAPGLSKRRRKMRNFYARIVQQARKAEILAPRYVGTLPSVARHRKRDVAFGRAGIVPDMFSFQLKRRRMAKIHQA